MGITSTFRGVNVSLPKDITPAEEGIEPATSRSGVVCRLDSYPDAKSQTS